MKNKMNISNLNENAGSTTGSGTSYQSDNYVTTLNNPNISTSYKTTAGPRSLADLSHLPVEEENVEGVIMKESIEDDLLGEGSIFEDYLKEKEKEREEIDAAIDAHNEMVAAQLGEDLPEEITDEDVERSTEIINNQPNIPDDDELEIDDSDEYIDPLERELEEDNRFVSNISEVEKEVSSNNKIASTVMSEDLGKDVSFMIDEEDLLDDERNPYY